MGSWRPNHACNRFDETQASVDIDLARFQHFQERYVNQLKSLKLEANVYRNVEARVNDLKDMCSWTNNEVIQLIGIPILHLHFINLLSQFQDTIHAGCHQSISCQPSYIDIHVRFRILFEKKQRSWNFRRESKWRGTSSRTTCWLVRTRNHCRKCRRFEDKDSRQFQVSYRRTDLTECYQTWSTKTSIFMNCRYCETRCKVLMEHIREAEVKNSWEMK